MTVPAKPKIYHIVHVDRLPSIIADEHLWCDYTVIERNLAGTTIGMSRIKQRRLRELTLASHPELYVGDCVPFYFCPRSIMLYLIHQSNHPDMNYRGGQEPILHLQADLYTSVAWAEQHAKRWAFTLSNAGSNYFEDRCDLANLHEVNWQAVQANRWGGSSVAPSLKEGKQAEFLLEHSFPWHLVERIGVYTDKIYHRVLRALSATKHRPQVEIQKRWYY